ncbi:MAG: hypothetical protein K2N06_08835 [Oscillospiraceae bacterium]|nr:hypothetical protein [Oscillospiraceae bacterium]
MKNEMKIKKNNPVTWIIAALLAVMGIYLVVRPEDIPMEDYSAIACLSTSVIVFIQFTRTKNRRMLVLGICLAAAGVLCAVTFLRKLIGA